MQEKVLMKGNEAIAEAAIRGGCRYFFGYPITPQNEIPEYMSWRIREVGGDFVQAESEVAAINMVYGAAGAGARAMTSSSSPGISLKQEGISYIACAELPCVIVNMVRSGPGLGGILASQCDYFQTVRAEATATTSCLPMLLLPFRRLWIYSITRLTRRTNTALPSAFWATVCSDRLWSR